MEVNYQAIKARKDSWEKIYNRSLSFPANISNLIEKTVLLPQGELFIPIITAFVLTPSALADIIPILFCYGDTGSGKSNLGFLISKIYGIPVCSPNDTEAGIKRLVDQIRCQDDFEKNILIVLDDFSIWLLDTKPELYTFLKTGYDRDSAWITISDREGRAKRFYTFCGKVISSIDSLSTHFLFSELGRRAITIPFKQWEKLSSIDKAKLGINAYDARLNLKKYNWDGFSNLIEKYWDRDKAIEYIKTQSELYATKCPPKLTSHQWTICLDLVCTGLVTGIWTSLNEAVQHLSLYWRWHKESIDESPIIGLVKEFLAQELKSIQMKTPEKWQEYLNNKCIKLHPRKLKQAVEDWKQDGFIDIVTPSKEINSAMQKHGWKLRPGVWVREI